MAFQRVSETESFYLRVSPDIAKYQTCPFGARSSFRVSPLFLFVL
jgi:hypothetical protein